MKALVLLAVFLFGWTGVYYIGKTSYVKLGIFALLVGFLVYLSGGLEDAKYIVRGIVYYGFTSKICVLMFDNMIHHIEHYFDESDTDDYMFALIWFGISILILILSIILFWFNAISDITYSLLFVIALPLFGLLGNILKPKEDLE